MLVLTRKLNQGIVVGGNVEITVLQVRGNRIRLGISAPSDVSIRRGELTPLPLQEFEFDAIGDDDEQEMTPQPR